MRMVLLLPRLSSGYMTLLAVLLISSVPGLVSADQVEMQNGDRYVGKVLSLNTNALVLQSDVLGTVTLPRAKVALVSLGTVIPTNRPVSVMGTQVRTPSVARTNSNVDLAAAFRQLGPGTNMIEQVRQQYLSDATPEVNAKYNEMLSGLMSGKMSMNDLRAQAKSAADQLRSMKGEMGDQTGILDEYLGILDNFLKETGPAKVPSVKVPQTTTPKLLDEE
jgi:hypothetical protein